MMNRAQSRVQETRNQPTAAGGRTWKAGGWPCWILAAPRGGCAGLPAGRAGTAGGGRAGTPGPAEAVQPPPHASLAQPAHWSATSLGRKQEPHRMSQLQHPNSSGLARCKPRATPTGSDSAAPGATAFRVHGRTLILTALGSGFGPTLTLRVPCPCPPTGASVCAPKAVPTPHTSQHPPARSKTPPNPRLFLRILLAPFNMTD